MDAGKLHLKGHAFGPGFTGSGKAIDFSADERGLSLDTPQADDGAPRWNDIAAHDAGWDGRQLRLEWTRDGRTYSLVAGGTEASALRRLAARHGALKKNSSHRSSGRLALLIILITIALPLALLGTLAWQHERIAAWAVSHIPVEQEARLGEVLFEQQKARLRLVEGPALDMVRGIGAQLTPGSPYRYQFHVAEDPVVNAYAMPGGYVVVHTGLLRLASSAEEVAGVLAHEVQHVEQRHSLRAMAQSLGLSALLHVLLGDISALGSLGGDLIKLKFSRDHESEADSAGLKALVAAHINPAGMRDFFAKMATQDKPGQLDPGFLSTHPASAERMAAMEEQIRTLPDAARRAPALRYDYASIKAALGGASR